MPAVLTIAPPCRCLGPQCTDNCCKRRNPLQTFRRTVRQRRRRCQSPRRSRDQTPREEVRGETQDREMVPCCALSCAAASRIRRQEIPVTAMLAHASFGYHL